MVHEVSMFDNKKRHIEFEQLYKANYSKLFFCSFDILGDEEWAKDIVGDVFSRAWDDYSRLRQTNLPNYLYITVRNRSIDCVRRQMRLQKINRHLVDLEVEWYEHHTDEEKEDKLRRVNHAIQKLPEKVGLIFRRCCFDGLTYRQVAEEMCLSEASIHKYMVKAFAELRNNI